MSDYIFLNGQILPYESAHIAPGDASFLHGAGLFETMHSRNGKVFRLADHRARITASAAALSINLTLEQSDFAAMIAELLEANDLDNQDARLRLTISRGDLHALTPDQSAPPLTLVLSAAPFTPYPAALYAQGMTVIVSQYRQNPQSPLTGHKTTSYVDRLLALREAQEKGAGEALWFTSTNLLAEASIANVFLVAQDNTLITPPLTATASQLGLATPDSPIAPDSPPLRLCLPGVTRQVILNLAIEMNLLPHERLITINEVLAAKEMFITNAVMGAMPVVRLERHAIGNEKPGQLTQKLSAAYQAKFTEETNA